MKTKIFCAWCGWKGTIEELVGIYNPKFDHIVCPECYEWEFLKEE